MGWGYMNWFVCQSIRSYTDIVGLGFYTVGSVGSFFYFHISGLWDVSTKKSF